MKKVLVLSLALILLLGITGHGTSSYFSDTETSSGNIFTAWVEECVCSMFNVSDNHDNKLYGYDDSGNPEGSFNLAKNNQQSSGVATWGDYVYVLDQDGKEVYKYDCCGTYEELSRTLKPEFGTSSIANPAGLAIDGNEMWVVSINDKKIYLYSLSAAFDGTGVPLTATREIILDDANTGPIGLAIDSTYLYVLDFQSSGQDKEIRFYRYDRTTGACGIGDISKVLRDGAGSNLGHGGCNGGAMFDGTLPKGSLWVVESYTDKAYRYDNVASLFPGDSNTVDANFEFPLHAENGNPSGM